MKNWHLISIRFAKDKIFKIVIYQGVIALMDNQTY